MRFMHLPIVALMLAGCAEGASFGSFGSLSGPAPRPKTIVVSDFIFDSDVVAVDRGFTARLERKVGGFPTHERKQRTNERVNDEIVASIVASLREAGFDAQPGNEDSISVKDDMVFVSGRLRPADRDAGKKNLAGFGSGRSGVIAEMAATRNKRQLSTFTADGGKRAGAPVAGKLTASRNSMIAESLVASKAAAEKLSPDVEAQARSLGRATGEKVVAFAREQGWLTKPEGAEAAPEAEARVKLLDPKPARMPAGRKPPQPADPDDPDKPN